MHQAMIFAIQFDRFTTSNRVANSGFGRQKTTTTIFCQKQAINKWYFTETADLDFHMQHDGQHDATIFKPCPSLSHVCQMLIKNLGVNTGGLLSPRLTAAAGGVVTTSMKVM